MNEKEANKQAQLAVDAALKAAEDSDAAKVLAATKQAEAAAAVAAAEASTAAAQIAARAAAAALECAEWASERAALAETVRARAETVRARADLPVLLNQRLIELDKAEVLALPIRRPARALDSFYRC
jgi:hypothetical protein